MLYVAAPYITAFLILGPKLKCSQKERRKCSKELKQSWILRNTRPNPFPQQADATLQMPVRDEPISTEINLASILWQSSFFFQLLLRGKLSAADPGDLFPIVFNGKTLLCRSGSIVELPGIEDGIGSQSPCSNPFSLQGCFREGQTAL